MPDEPPAAGGGMQGMFQGTARSGGILGTGIGARNYRIDASFDLKIPGVEAVSKSIGLVNEQLGELKQGLKDLSSNQYILSQGITSMLGKMEKQAQATATALGAVNQQTGSLGRGGGGVVTPGGSSAPASFNVPMSPSFGSYRTASEAGWDGPALASASQAQAAAAGGGAAAGGMAAGLLGGGSGLMQSMGDLFMMPMRFMRERIQNNRQSALYMQQALSPLAFASGRSNAAGMSDILGNLANFPRDTGVAGTQADIMGVLGIGRQVGATYGFGGQFAPRAPGFMQGISEMQRMSPGTPSGQLAMQLGQQVGNVQSQQMAAFYTGGAFAMVKPGGKMKSVQEWAEGLLRWLENQRPGRDRGKAFTYGELLAQHFPGSNIDAWMTMNGITPDMKEVFWNYAEGKSNKTGGTQGAFEIEKPGGNLAWERLRSQTEFTKGEFGLASKMGGQYANRETMNRWFNQLMATITNKVIPAITGPGSPLSIIQYLPDFIEDMLFGMLESAGPFAQVLGGTAFNVGAMSGGAMGGGTSGGGGGQTRDEVLDQLRGGPLGGFGDVGDVGDYGTMGGTSTAGLHPDMRKKVNAMMRANPRITMTSGLRDRSTQMRLKRAGVGRVSGRPSSHTRGMAADLGPRSQYGWIAANARRFGLASGAGQGEPWHVGMGDVGDDQAEVDAMIADLQSGGGGGMLADFGKIFDVIGMMGKLFGGIWSGIDRMSDLLSGTTTGLTSATKMMEAGKAGTGIGAFMQGNIGGFLDLLLGGLGGWGANEVTPTAFDPNLGKSLPTNITIGGSTAGAAGARGYMPKTMGPAGGVPKDPNNPNLGGGTVASNQQLGQQMAAARGWTGAQWTALQELWAGESGWSHTADNPNSSAYGIPQALPGSKMASAGADWQTNPATQIAWGLDYISGRYGDPVKALAFWKSKSPHWYATGAWSTGNEYARLHKGEMVLPATIAESVRNVTRAGGNSSQVVFHNTFNIGSGGNGASNNIDMRRTVTMIADHLETEMNRRTARAN